MSDLRNEPPESDHDLVVRMYTILTRVENDVNGLREWRHDSVAPVMMVLQAQQKSNTDSITRLTGNVNRLLEVVGPLIGVPVDLRDHRESDERAFTLLNGSLDQIHEKVDRNRAERASGQKAIILWVAGLIIAGLGVLVTFQWTVLSPHLTWTH